MRYTSLSLGVSSNREVGLRAAEHQVDPRGAPLGINATRKVRIHEQMRTGTLQPAPNPSPPC
eukprot:11025780-Lingulodinium_polyedra.AAC.1